MTAASTSSRSSEEATVEMISARTRDSVPGAAAIQRWYAVPTAGAHAAASVRQGRPVVPCDFAAAWPEHAPVQREAAILLLGGLSTRSG